MSYYLPKGSVVVQTRDTDIWNILEEKRADMSSEYTLYESKSGVVYRSSSPWSEGTIHNLITLPSYIVLAGGV